MKLCKDCFKSIFDDEICNCKVKSENKVLSPIQATEFFKQPISKNKKMAMDCLLLIESAQGKKDIYDGMLLLDEMYPNVGFRQHAEKYKKEAKLKGEI